MKPWLRMTVRDGRVPTSAAMISQKIADIGAAIERRLHDARILIYQDLAACTPRQSAATLTDMAGISAERIDGQDRTTQARRLAGPLAPPLLSEPSQHYVSFHIELLLNVDNNSVRRTKVHHYQSDTDFAWPGWDEGRLLAVLRDHIPPTASQQPPETIDLQSSTAPPVSRSETAVPPSSQPEMDSQAITLLPSCLRIEELTPIREGQKTYVWPSGEPASVRLTLHVNQTSMLRAATFDFTAAITARSVLGDNQRLPLGTMQGAVRVGESRSVQLTGPPLPRGLYRLQAAVHIYPTGHTLDSQPLHSRHLLGELIQVADVPAQTAPAPT